MKKYITFDSVGFAMSLLTFLFVVCTLCSACINLHNRTSPVPFTEDQIKVLDNLEKPLAFDGMFLDDSES